jgi:hypothetical protein
VDLLNFASLDRLGVAAGALSKLSTHLLNEVCVIAFQCKGYLCHVPMARCIERMSDCLPLMPN